MNRKKIMSIIVSAIIALNLFSVPVITLADVEYVGNTSEKYDNEEDFDKGEMRNVSYNGGGSLELTKQESDEMVSLVYTLNDIVLFGYEDDSKVTIYNSDGEIIWNGTINKGETEVVNISYLKGVYKVVTSKKISILTGDPITNGVSGYYAMDQDGYGASKDMYVKVPKKYDKCALIVTSMEDDNYVVVENLTNNTIAFSGTLNEGEHYSIPPEKANVQYMYHVTSTKKSSALVDYDQSYYVPDVNGKWSGTKLYTHIGNTGNWAHELTVYSYADNNNVTITNTETNEVIWSGTLNYGENHVLSYENGTDTYVKIESSDTVTAAVQPWKIKTGKYAQGTYIADKDGSGIGNEFLGSCIDEGYIYVMAYADNTTINLYDSLDSNKLLDTITLNKGENYKFTPENGAYYIKSNKAISAYSGYGSANAGFAPIQYGDNTRSKEGSWTVIKDSEQEDNIWGSISWSGRCDSRGKLTVSYRTANTLEELNKAEYTQAVNFRRDYSIKGRYIEVKVDFETYYDDYSPVLNSITIGEILTVDFSASIGTSKSSIYDNEELEVIFKLENKGNADDKEKRYAIMLYDENDEFVDIIDIKSYKLQDYMTFGGRLKVKGSDLDPGEYTVKLLDATDGLNTFLLDSCKFTVEKNPNIEKVSGSISADKDSIYNNESLKVNYSIKNDGNVKLSSKEYRVRLLDENNNKIKDLECAGYSLEVEASFDDTIDVAGSELPIGQYTVQLVGVDGDTEEVLDSCSFSVLEQLVDKVTGNISGDKDVISNKESLNIDYSINNAGNVDIEGREYKIKLLDENKAEVKELVQSAFSLQCGNSYNGSYELVSDDLKNGNYTVQLTATKDGVEEVLASYDFKNVILQEDEPVIDVKPTDVNKPKEEVIAGQENSVKDNSTVDTSVATDTLIRPDAAVNDVKDNNKAKTGDNSNALGYLAASIVSLAAIVLAIKNKLFKVKSDK